MNPDIELSEIVQESALNPKDAAILESTERQIHALLNIIQATAGLNHANPEMIGGGFDSEVKMSASATLITANSRLQGILNDAARWRTFPLPRKKERENPKEDKTFNAARTKMKQRLFLESGRHALARMRNARKLEKVQTNLAVEKASKEQEKPQ